MPQAAVPMVDVAQMPSESCIIPSVVEDNNLKCVSFSVELEIRRDKAEIGEDVILLTVEDPKSEVGSGGATLNALLVVAEYISAKQGYTV